MSGDSIDIVVTWVDGNDPAWLKEKLKHLKKAKSTQPDDPLFDGWNTSKIRYRDWDCLRYWFRGVEQNCKWVNKIYFVTAGHIPDWLNVDNERLVIVKHEDFIPKKYLPTFNSNAIELNLHRINGLSDNFVYFNDDVYVLRKTKTTDFFKNGLPRGSAILNLVMPDEMSHSEYNNTVIENRHFNKNKTILRNPSKWFNLKYFPQGIRTLLLMPWPKFPRLYAPHITMPHQKKYFEYLWDIETSELDKTCLHKFRNSTDLSHWIMSDWYLLTGNFIPRATNLGKHFEQKIDDKIVDIIKQRKIKVACINDIEGLTEEEFIDQRNRLKDAFETIFPERSSFEKCKLAGTDYE